MPMFLFLIVALSLACGSAPARPAPLAVCLGGPLALAGLWIAVAEIAVRSALRREQQRGSRGAGDRVLQRYLEGLRYLILPAALHCLLGFGLAGAMQTWPLVAQSMALQAALLLSPGMLLLAAPLWAEQRYAAAVGATERSARGGAGAAVTTESLLAALRGVGSSLLQTTGWLMAPVLAMLLAADLLSGLPGTERIPAGLAPALLSLLALPVIVPWLAKRLWPTRPLEAADQQAIAAWIDAAGVGPLEVRVWETGGHSCNAVVIGFLPAMRTLLLTDRLLRELSAEQLRLIVLHEVAHIRRHHIWLRLVAVLPGWVLAAALLHLWGSGPLLLLVSHVAAVAVTLVMLRLSAHATEFDADRIACELALQAAAASARPGRGSDDARAAAEVLAQALGQIARAEGADRRGSWLHPSLDSRCARLRTWATEVMQPAGPPAVTG